MSINKFVFIDIWTKMLLFVLPLFLFNQKINENEKLSDVKQKTETPYYWLATLGYLLFNFINHKLNCEGEGIGKYIWSFFIGMAINLIILFFFGAPILKHFVPVIQLSFVLTAHGFQNIGMFAKGANELYETMFPLKVKGIFRPSDEVSKRKLFLTK